MIKFLEKYNYNYAIVDTNDLSIEETLNKCKKIIENNKILKN